VRFRQLRLKCADTRYTYSLIQHRSTKRHTRHIAKSTFFFPSSFLAFRQCFAAYLNSFLDRLVAYLTKWPNLTILTIVCHNVNTVFATTGASSMCIAKATMFLHAAS